MGVESVILEERKGWRECVNVWLGSHSGISWVFKFKSLPGTKYWHGHKQLVAVLENHWLDVQNAQLWGSLKTEKGHEEGKALTQIRAVLQKGQETAQMLLCLLPQLTLLWLEQTSRWKSFQGKISCESKQISAFSTKRRAQQQLTQLVTSFITAWIQVHPLVGLRLVHWQKYTVFLPNGHIWRICYFIMMRHLICLAI